MTTLTRTEIRWIIYLINESEEKAKVHGQRNDIPDLFKELYHLRAANMASLSDKLNNLLNSGNKRIAIK